MKFKLLFIFILALLAAGCMESIDAATSNILGEWLRVSEKKYL